MSAAAAAAAGPHAGNTPSKARATRPPNSWPLGPRERPGTARTPASRLLDVGHRVLVSALILGTGYLAYQMASGVYQIRKRRMTWEAEHPEEVAAFVAKQKADKEAEKEKKERERVEKTALLKAKLAEEEIVKQQHQQQVEQEQQQHADQHLATAAPAEQPR